MISELKNKLRGLYYKMMWNFGAFKYDLGKKKYQLPEVFTIEETLDRIIKKRVSVSRYGDGEFAFFNSKTRRIVFQDFDEKLATRLKEIIMVNDDRILICLPESFRSLDGFVKKKFHKNFIQHSYSFFFNYIRLSQKYDNAHMSRPFRDFQNYGIAEQRFNLIKKIWEDRDVVIIEGVNSRIGVGTDLFSKANSLHRILCPTSNAYRLYSQILDRAKLISKDFLILIALGPTATVLAYDLAMLNFQAIDIGHIGSEYFSFLKAAKQTNRLTKHNYEMYDEQYESEIVDRINHF